MKRHIPTHSILTTLLLLTFILQGASALHARRPVREYFNTPVTAVSDTLITLTAPTPSALHKALEIRAAATNANNKRTSAENVYGVAFAISDNSDEYYSATLSPASDNDNEIYSTQRAVTFTLSHHRNNSPDSIIIVSQLTDGFETQRFENTISVEIDCRTGDVEILGGNQSALPITSVSIPPEKAKRPMGIISRGNPTFSIIVSEYIPDPATLTSSSHTPESIAGYLASTAASHHQIEGYWQYLDRETDPLYTRPGGQYTLAIIANPETRAFDIIYISGAQTNASRWFPGMKKGELRPTQFEGTYELEWYDAAMEIVEDESSARIEVGGEVLCMEFPLLKAKMRFSRHRDM